jgi:hypothetical protein
MPRPSHSSLFDHPNNIWWGVQIIKLLIMYFSSLPCYLVPLRPKYFPQHPILKDPQPTFMFIPCILNNKCLLYTNICTNK